MARFPRRIAPDKGRTLIAAGLCLALAFFAFTSGSNRLKLSAGQVGTHVEGRSLRAASTDAPLSWFGSASCQIPPNDKKGDDVLVLYLYDNKDPVSAGNLEFFLQWGIAAHDGCVYVILVTETMYADKESLPGYETLPQNAEYAPMRAENCSMGLGVLGQALNTKKAQSWSPKHYIFLNSYVRGPFLPNYLMDNMHWTRLFTRKINAEVKLVGPTISCEDPPHISANSTVPFVQFSAMATDKAGLDVILKNGSIFACHNASWQDVILSEMGASRAILNAGFTLDSFMLRYRKVDWRQRRNWGCNARYSPVGEFFNDGATITPFETVFVRMSTLVIENNWSFARQAAIYQDWLHQQNVEALDANSNTWISDPWPIKHQRIAYMQSKGPGCFDHRYYLRKSPDLKVLKTVLELWEHFLMLGQFEGRSYRFSCDDERKLPY